MKAIVQDKYGSPDDVLELRDIDKPVAMDDEVLIRVHAASVNTADRVLMTGIPYIARPTFGIFKPRRKTLGLDAAGRVEAVGINVSQFQPGDEVFTELPGFEFGTFAEYVCVSEQNALAPKPANLSFEEAAAVPLAAITALHGLRDLGEIQPGQKVLINGASGGVGTFAVQIAKALGAEVTGVCSTTNADMVRSLGADHVIDYTQTDVIHSGQRYDVMLDMVGNHSLSACRRMVKPMGTYVSGAGQVKRRWLGPTTRLLRMLVISPFVSQKMVTINPPPTKADLVVLKGLVEAGKVTPVIDRSYPINETAAAMAHIGAGHARGKIVVTV